MVSNLVTIATNYFGLYIIMNEVFWIQKSSSLKSILVCKPRRPNKHLEGWPHQLSLHAYTIANTCSSLRFPSYFNHNFCCLSFLNPHSHKYEPWFTLGGSEHVRSFDQAKYIHSIFFFYQVLFFTFHTCYWLFDHNSCVSTVYFLFPLIKSCFPLIKFSFHQLFLFTHSSNNFPSILLQTSVFVTILTGYCYFLHFNRWILCLLGCSTV